MIQEGTNLVREECIASSANPKLKITLPPAITSAVEELFRQS
jgi:hypothetical protein